MDSLHFPTFVFAGSSIIYDKKIKEEIKEMKKENKELIKRVLETDKKIRMLL